MTQPEIQALIDEIQPDSNYTANQLRVLLTDILDSCFSDRGLEVLTMTNGGTQQAAVGTANINLTANVANFTMKLPATPYTGKTVCVFVDASGTVSGTLTILSATDAAVYAITAAALDTYFFTYNGTAWINTGFSGTIV